MATFKKSEYFVRPMCIADNEEVNEVCAKAGLCLGNCTNLTMMKIDPNCLHVAESLQTGRILGVCAGIILNPNLAFIGEYAVHPSFQKQGIGQSLWKKTIDHCGDRNVCLYAAPKMISTYKDKCGFKVIPARKMIAYSGTPQLFNLNKYLTDCDIEWISGNNIGDVIEYDEAVCGLNRSQFLEYSVAEPDTVSLLARYISNGNVAGYAIFKTSNMNSITPQPLYADNDAIAEALTYNCISKFVAYDGLFLELWDLNEGANWLAIKMGLTIHHQSPIMFTKEDVTACNFKNIYFVSPSDFYPF